jgi:membrane protease YdiL (CAAX protease family)
MKTQFATVPAIRLDPVRRSRLNRLRLNIDTIGLYGVKVLSSLGGLLPGPIALLLGIYNMAAYITVLTVDPSRLPEAGTTRTHQKQAWGLLLRIIPIVAVVMGLLAWSGALTLALPSVFPPVGLLLTCYTDELLFRNILQPWLRRIGLSRSAAVGGQSLLFTLPYAIGGASIGMIAVLVMLGLLNGYIVYRHRSLWPAYALALAVRMISGIH